MKKIKLFDDFGCFIYLFLELDFLGFPISTRKLTKHNIFFPDLPSKFTIYYEFFLFLF